MPFAELIAKGQECAQTWERVLHSSGGALELKKCFWCMVYWQWANGRPEMVPNIGCPGIIALTSGNAPNYAVIPRLEAWEARRTLGARPAPDGNYRKEGEFLMSKANQRASRLAASNLSEMDVFIFHRSARAVSMTCSLPATTLEPKVLSKAQSRAIRAILNKLGVNKSFPRRVAFGPKDARGVALLGASVDQEHDKCSASPTARSQKTPLGISWSLLCDPCSSNRVVASTCRSAPVSGLRALRAAGVTRARGFLDRSKMTIKIASAKHVQPSREHDQFIMDELRALGPRDNRQLLDLNAVRARLQVTTAPDAADAQGKKITKEALEGVKPTDRCSKMKWPRQPVTTAKQRSLWKAALGAAFAPSGRALAKSLGKWAGPPTQAWRSLHDPRASRIVASATGPVTRLRRAWRAVEPDAMSMPLQARQCCGTRRWTT